MKTEQAQNAKMEGNENPEKNDQAQNAKMEGNQYPKVQNEKNEGPKGLIRPQKGRKGPPQKEPRSFRVGAAQSLHTA